MFPQLNNVFDVAVKSLHQQGAQNQMSVDRFIEEAKVMHKLCHAKIVRLLGVCTQSMPMFATPRIPLHSIYFLIFNSIPFISFIFNSILFIAFIF